MSKQNKIICLRIYPNTHKSVCILLRRVIMHHSESKYLFLTFDILHNSDDTAAVAGLFVENMLNFDLSFVIVGLELLESITG